MNYLIISEELSLLRRSIVPIVTACLVLAACQDASEPVAPLSSTAAPNQAEGRGFAQRLYAIGTSISAGTCSDGNVASCQQNSWVAQIIRAMHREPTLPLISETGCKAPFAAPLITFQRKSGESVVVSDAAVICSANEAGVSLPTQVLAIPGAWTHEALHQTPAARTDPFGSRLYRRILPLNESQVTALETVNPKFVTVELGANDILQVLSGALIPFATYTPFATWSATYDSVLDRVGAVTKQALLVGIVSDISQFAALRRGSELWADRAAFLSAFNVEVSSDCDGSANLIVVPYLVTPAVANGLIRRAQGLSAFVLSCLEGGQYAVDRILTPDEEAAANVLLVQMTDHVRAQAVLRGYAFMDLEVLFSVPKAPFSVVTLMTSGTPYGTNVSLDGVHPAAAGQTLIAQAALQAIDARYNIGLEEALANLSRWP